MRLNMRNAPGLALAGWLLAGCGILGGGEQTAPPLPPTAEGQNFVAPTETPLATAAPPTPQPTANTGDVLFVSKGQVWAVEPDGGNLRQMTSLPDGAAIHDLSVSPKGKYAGYTINGTLAEILELATGRRFTLDLANQARFDSLAWAPDDSAVYFHKLILDANSAPAKSQIWKVALPQAGAPERVLEVDLATGPMSLPIIGLDSGQVMIHEFTPGGDAGTWRAYDSGTDGSTPVADGFGLWDAHQGFQLLFSKAELTPGQFSVPIGLYQAEGGATPARISPLDDDLAAYTGARYGLLTDQIAVLRYTQDANGTITAGAALIQLGEGDVYQLTLLATEPGTRDVAVAWADTTHVIVQRLRGDVSEIWLLPTDGSAGKMIAAGEQPCVVGGR